MRLGQTIIAILICVMLFALVTMLVGKLGAYGICS